MSRFKLPSGAQADAKTAVVAWLFTVSILTVVALNLPAYFSDVKLRLHYSSAWWAAYAVVSLVVLLPLYLCYRFQNLPLTLAGGVFKRWLSYCAGAGGFLLIINIAIFAGLPVILHHLNKQPGSVVVRVDGKYGGGSRHRCSPYLSIREFHYWMSDYFCPGSETYAKISVGDKLKLIGLVSPYGVEVERFQWLPKTTVVPKYDSSFFNQLLQTGSRGR